MISNIQTPSNPVKKAQYVSLFDHYRFCRILPNGGAIVEKARFPRKKFGFCHILKSLQGYEEGYKFVAFPQKHLARG